MRIKDAVVLFALLLGVNSTSHGGLWTQTLQEDFLTDQLNKVSITNSPGDVMLICTKEVTGRILQPSFEYLPTPLWGKSSGSGCFTDMSYIGTDTQGTGLPTDGARVHCHRSEEFIDSVAGYYASSTQRVDFTGLQNMTFDAAFVGKPAWLGKAQGEIRIDGASRWLNTTAGTSSNVSVNVSDLTGMHKLELRMTITASFSKTNRQFIFWDNFRTYQADSYYLAEGTILSPALTRAAYEKWQDLTFDATVTSNTSLRLDVVNASLVVIASNVASGTDLYSLGITQTPIRLRATLVSSNGTDTPVLHGWAVNWNDNPNIAKVEFVTSVSSGREDVASVPLTVQLSPVQSETVSVSYAVSGGTASNALDYTLASGSLVFEPGQTNLSVPLVLIDDALIEGDETVRITLSNTSHAVFGNSTNTFTILGDGDADGMEDDWENQYFGNLSHSGGDDGDLDGVTDLEEFVAHSIPVNPDADGDGFLDGDELYGDGTHGDKDGYVTDPSKADTDGDGYSDAYEVAQGRHPANPHDVAFDADGDGLNDYAERLLGTDATNAASPVTVYVNGATGSDTTGDGTVDKPYATVQKGITSATAPAIVRIAAGVYTGNIKAKTRVALIGSGSATTTLNGNSTGKVIQFDDSAKAVVANLSIVNGQSQTSHDVTEGGSGIFLKWGYAYLCGVVFRDNKATTGKKGTVYLNGYSLRAENCEFLNNQDSESVVEVAGSNEFVNCLFSNPGQRVLYNVVSTVPTITLRNCTFANSNGGVGIQFFPAGSGSLKAYNCIFWGNGDEIGADTFTLDHCCTEDTDAGTGMIYTNPGFANAAASNFQLSAVSPCVDAGNGDQAPPRDAFGRLRVDNPLATNICVGIPSFVDMGYAELDDADADGLSDYWEMKWLGNLSHGPGEDGDVDGLSNLEEVAALTDPTKADTDGDGLKDGDERYGDGTHGDSDGFVTYPLKPDSDGDGVLDSEEVKPGTDGFITNPNSVDSDWDGTSDSAEIAAGRDPVDSGDLDEDEDGDGLPLYGEMLLGTDPRDAAAPVTIHVDAAIGSDASGNGSSSKPFATIQKAIDVSRPPAMIKISAGTYKEHVVGKTGIALVGSGAETTILDAEDAGSPVSNIGVLVGLSLIRGQMVLPSPGYLRSVDIRKVVVGGQYGKALEVSRVARISGCRLVDNTIWHTLYASGIGNTDITLINCLFANNSTYALTAEFCNPLKIINCTIRSAGMSQQSSRVMFYNSIITGGGVNGGVEVYYGNTTNPLFRAESYKDYQLATNSSCIDAAEGFIAPKKDLLGYLRHDHPGKTNVGTGNPRYADLGCFEADFTDVDADGLYDRWEIENFGGLGYNTDMDPDDDGLSNQEEFIAHTDPTQADTDGDGILDGDELYGDGTHGDKDGYVTDPLNADTDGDGIADGEEVTLGVDGFITRPDTPDTDLDGYTDGFEVAHGLNPLDNSDADNDPDGDGLPTFGEAAIGSDPFNPLSPVKIYVNVATGNDSTGNGSMELPYASVQKGIDSAVTTTVIRVAAGRYREKITVKNNTVIVGAGRDMTIVDAEGGGNPVTIVQGANAVLAGLTLMGGGCAINAPQSSSSSRTIYLYEVNAVSNGTSLFASYGSLRVSRCYFRNTTTDEFAYEVFLNGVIDPVFVNSVIAMMDQGYAVCRFDACGNPKIINCAIVHNHGRGIYYDTAQTLTIANSILRTARNGETLDVVLANFAGGQVAITNSCLSQTGLGGAHNLVADPRFFAPELGDFTLRSDSPCIDAAAGLWLPSSDLNKMPRNDYPGRANTGTGMPAFGDMGCYEFGDADMDGLADSWEILYFSDLSHGGDVDSDSDGLTDREEYLVHTVPTEADTDDDGIKDGDELYGNGTHGDLDGLITDPLDSDCDNDGVLDGEEVRSGADGYVTNPHKEDTDYDGLTDSFEVANGLDPSLNGDSEGDTDGDGLSAYEEIAIGSNPAASNSPLAVFVNVSSGDDTTGDGSAGKPYASIQRGIDSVAAVPAVVKIAPGDYHENVVLKNKVALRGAGSAETILDGMGTGMGVSVPEGANVAIAGMTIINSKDGAVSCPGNETSPADRYVSLRDVVVEGNQGVVAVRVTGGKLRIIGSVIRNNTNRLTGRENYSSWASLYCLKVSKVSLINCLVANGRNGDGIAFGVNGAGLTFHYCPSVLIANCDILNNEPMGVTGIESNFIIANTIIWGNRTTFIMFKTGCGYWIMPWTRTVDIRFGQVQWYNCIVDDVLIPGVSHADPKLVDVKTTNCRLRPDSPAIDAGFGPAAPARDIRGAARVDDPAIPNRGSGTPSYAEIGCYEYVDVDRDGMDDPWETQYFGNLNHTGSADTDLDGLTDKAEFDAGTDPLAADTDGDGIKDGNELYGNGTHGDTDGFVSNPRMVDTDDDGILDGEEVVPGVDGYRTDPSKADTDADGMSDAFEISHGLNPLNKEDLDDDSDGDGVPRFGEIAIGSNPGGSASPAKCYVNAQAGSDITGDGSAFSPYASISKAVNMAIAPCAVHVAPGVYTEKVMMKDRVVLVGSGSTNTSVSAGGSGCAITYPEGASGALIGLSVTGGRTNHASGIYMPGTNVTRCVYLKDVTVSNNIGGGVDFSCGRLRAKNCIFSGNIPDGTVADCGGGIVCSHADVALVNCLSHHNERASAMDSTLMRHGDGIALSYCDSSVINCTVANNKRYGISSEYGSLQIVNSIVFYNTPNSIYGEVRNDITGHGDINVTYSYTMNLIPGEDLAAGVATVHHSAPRFSSDSRYMLLPNSPCIDAGNGDHAPLQDYFGNSRVDDPAMANFGKGMPAYSDIGYCETTDSDGDGMNDAWEVKFFGGLSHTGLVDTDSDGLMDIEEFHANTNPLKPDTDGDGLTDGNELYGDGTHGDTDGLISSPLMGDTDGDGILDGEEVVAGTDGYVTDPARADTDLDGFSDSYEVLHSMNPTVTTDVDADPDGDGLPSYGETLIGSVATNPASPVCLYVSALLGNDVTGDGTAGKPYRTIQKGIDSAGTVPAMVKVAAGEYRENLVLREKVALVGAGVRDTIIDGNASGRTIEASGITNCVLVGLSVKNGCATGSGGGINASWSNSGRLYLNDVCLLGNSASHNGGGLCVSNGLVRVVKSRIQQNTAANGAGAYCHNVYPCIFINSVITDNSSISGGGLYLANCFAGVEVVNCTVANNMGGGILFNYGWGTLINSIIWNNGVNLSKVQDFSSQNDIVTIACYIGNDGDGSGAIPAFFNPAQGDYHIMANSSLVDSGRSTCMPLADLDSELRWIDPVSTNQGSSFDIGAYEYADTDLDQLPDYWERMFLSNLSMTTTNDSDADGLSHRDEYLLKLNPANPDTDGDCQNDGDEVIAGTDPSDPSKFFCIKGVNNEAGQHSVLSWDSVTGRVYSLLYSSNLLSGWVGVPGYTNISGSGQSCNFTNSDCSLPIEFYSIQVQLGQ